MKDGMIVLGISGSLRKGSYNTALLRAAVELVPERMRIDIADIASVPPYDEDVREIGFPGSVAKLRDQIAGADAILVATPEYNYSLPGVLKNAIDWASRAPNQPFAGKPLGIIGASAGMGGTMRAQYHLRQVAVFLDMHPINKPEVFVRNARTAFDSQNKLVDDDVRKNLRLCLEALATWTRRLQETPRAFAE